MPISNKNTHVLEPRRKLFIPFYTLLSPLTSVKGELVTGNCLRPFTLLSQYHRVACDQQNLLTALEAGPSDQGPASSGSALADCRLLAVSSRSSRGRELCRASRGNGTDPTPEGVASALRTPQGPTASRNTPEVGT